MSRRTHIVVAAVCVSLVVVTTAAVTLHAWANPGYEPIDFDKKQWSQADSETHGHMVRDMLSRHELVGMTRQEITQLLGQPDEDQVDLQRYRYYVGNMGRNPEMPFFWGYSLLIKFDKTNKATEAHVADWALAANTALNLTRCCRAEFLVESVLSARQHRAG